MKKRMYRFLTAGICMLLLSAVPHKVMAQQKADAARAQALLRKMTLEEKIGQLNLVAIGIDVTGPVISSNVEDKIKKGLVGGVFNTYTPKAVRQLQEMAVKQSRLHIPLLFGYDVIHGHKTIFPIPLGIASTWDLLLIKKSARVAALESAADGLNWTFSPMVDIARDPRWGRIAESAGEDTWYGSQVAKAMVKGYQGNDLRKDNAILACVKHFALYGAAEAGRDYNTTDMSRIRMYQDYLPPYKAAIDAGAGSVMTSFNEVDGIPATGNSWLMKDLLRKQWGFNGLLVTDYGAIGEMTAHGSGNMQEVSALALQAGVDMDMMSDGFVATLQRSVKEGKVTLQQIDAACTRVLEVKYSLGLFDDPYKNCKEENAARYILSTENKAAAREVAEHSFVLLKNASNTLPLQKKGSIALIGPLADDQRNLIGNWSAAGDYTQSVSVKEGLSKLIGTAAQLQYAKGANLLEDENMIRLLNASRGEITKDSRSAIQLLQEAVALAKNSDVVVAVLGETQGMTGEAACRTNLGIPENQQQLLRALVQTGKPVVLVLMSGRPLTLTWEDAHVSAILETWFAGTEAGNAIANVLFGAYNPAGRLTATFPRSVGQIPLYYNHKNTGRPFDSSTQSMEKYKSRYIDESNDPLYPFGYGLSYTTFSYSSVRLSKASLQGNETLTASVTVTNTGSYAGEEVVQLYLSDPVASVTRPVKELKNFKKLLLQPGESKQVSFTITTEDLKFYNSNLQYVWEPGQFKVYIGTNSQTGNAASVQWNK